jgi:hypothetical protein
LIRDQQGMDRDVGWVGVRGVEGGGGACVPKSVVCVYAYIGEIVAKCAPIDNVGWESTPRHSQHKFLFEICPLLPDMSIFMGYHGNPGRY